MNGSAVSSDLRCRLASYIQDRRRELVTCAVRSPTLPLPESNGSGAFANALLDHLVRELFGEGDAVDAWADAGGGAGDAADHAGIVATVCAVVSASFVADCGHDAEAVAYLAQRSIALEARFRKNGAVLKNFEPLQFIRRDEIVGSLLSAMEARDRATCEHSRAVGLWCKRLATILGMDPPAQEQAMLAGTLHDVGKIATPSEILLKPGPLDATEWDVMRAHPQIGAKMLERIPSLAELADVVRHHHERMDGRGYPGGLEGEAIPWLARIVAVADSFHAMISKRPYREALTVPRALDELRAGSGTQWDSSVVDAMLAIVRPSIRERVLRVVGER